MRDDLKDILFKLAENANSAEPDWSVAAMFDEGNPSKELEFTTIGLNENLDTQMVVEVNDKTFTLNVSQSTADAIAEMLENQTTKQIEALDAGLNEMVESFEAAQF